MSRTMHFDFMTRSPPGDFRFLKLPKAFFLDPDLSGLSLCAKVLYGLMLDRSCISRENSWFDEEGRLFIFYSIKDAMDDLHISKPTAIAAFNELNDKSGIGLIHVRSQKKGKPNIIYVKDVTSKWVEPVKNIYPECQNDGHDGKESLPDRVKVFDPNETKGRETKEKETYLNDDGTTRKNPKPINEEEIMQNISWIYNSVVEAASKEIAAKSFHLMISKMKCFHNKEDMQIMNDFTRSTLVELFIEAYGLVTGNRQADDIQGYMYSVIEGKIAERK